MPRFKDFLEGLIRSSISHLPPKKQKCTKNHHATAALFVLSGCADFQRTIDAPDALDKQVITKKSKLPYTRNNLYQLPHKRGAANVVTAGETLIRNTRARARNEVIARGWCTQEEFSETDMGLGDLGWIPSANYGSRYEFALCDTYVGQKVYLDTQTGETWPDDSDRLGKSV